MIHDYILKNALLVVTMVLCSA